MWSMMQRRINGNCCCDDWAEVKDTKWSTSMRSLDTRPGRPEKRMLLGCEFFFRKSLHFALWCHLLYLYILMWWLIYMISSFLIEVFVDIVYAVFVRLNCISMIDTVLYTWKIIPLQVFVHLIFNLQFSIFNCGWTFLSPAFWHVTCNSIMIRAVPVGFVFYLIAHFKVPGKHSP